MQAQAGKTWENLISGFWFVPALLVMGAVLLSSLLLFVDEMIVPDLEVQAPWLFAGTPGAARSLLSAIATSLITVVSVAFSITLVALQQAASQYSPRVLRNFTSDRGSQVVLGTYLATFVYALLVMRQIRETDADGSAFVPALSITVAVGLTLASIGMLVYYIDHISKLLQVSAILSSIRDELHRETDKLFPSEFARGSQDPPDTDTLLARMADDQRGAESVIRSGGSGYLRRIDEGQLEKTAEAGLHLVEVPPRIGDYVHRDAVLARVWSEQPVSEGTQRRIEGSFALDRERSMHQDPLFGIRQMVDIAVKALSPGVNDPTTAEQSLNALGDTLVRLAGRQFPSPLRRTEPGTHYLFNRPSFADFVDAAFSQVRRSAARDVHVTLYLLDVLGEIVERVPSRERAAPLRNQVQQILAALDAGNVTDGDRQAIVRRAEGVLATVHRRKERLHRAA